MTVSGSEVPLALRSGTAGLVTEGDGRTFADVATFVESRSTAVPDTCPDCGGELIVTAVCSDPNESPVAVRLTCTTMHDGTRIATYIYEPGADDLSLELEEEPQMLVGDWGDEQ